MHRFEETVKTLREILENVRNPASLNTHPWINSLIVREAVKKDSGLSGLNPGQQLLLTIGGLFETMMPIVPPRRGLRLDTRWGEFGLLAAQYFAPLSFGVPYPSTLRESWSRIDEALLLFVYGNSRRNLSDKQIGRYRLVGDE